MLKETLSPRDYWMNKQNIWAGQGLVDSEKEKPVDVAGDPQPEKDLARRRELASVKAEISSLQKKIKQIRLDIALFTRRKNRYKTSQDPFGSLEVGYCEKSIRLDQDKLFKYEYELAEMKRQKKALTKKKNPRQFGEQEIMNPETEFYKGYAVDELPEKAIKEMTLSDVKDESDNGIKAERMRSYDENRKTRGTEQQLRRKNIDREILGKAA